MAKQFGLNPGDAHGDRRIQRQRGFNGGGCRAEPLFQTSNLAYQTGDGLVMATAVGAGVQNLDQVQVYLREVENRTSQFPYMFTIFVGQDGRRFMDEKRTAQTWNQEIKR